MKFIGNVRPNDVGSNYFSEIFPTHTLGKLYLVPTRISSDPPSVPDLSAAELGWPDYFNDHLVIITGDRATPWIASVDPNEVVRLPNANDIGPLDTYTGWVVADGAGAGGRSILMPNGYRNRKLEMPDGRIIDLQQFPVGELVVFRGRPL
jgi:hypothetical protein